MGFRDRLEQIGKGVTDIFTAPFGMVFDIARAAASDEYNPGFTGVFTPAVDQATRGISAFGEGTGLSALGRGIGEATPVDDWFKAFLDETELIYNHEFQMQQNRTPLGIRETPFGTLEPGEASLSRGLGTATGALGALAPGGEPAAQGVFRAWERSRQTSPGRALVDNVIGFYQRTPQEQDAIRSGITYNLVTGTFDAASRWFLQPEVVAGKGIKKARQAYNFDPLKRLNREVKAAKRQGYNLKQVMEEADATVDRSQGAFHLQLSGARNRSVYHVTRRSRLGAKSSADMDPEGPVQQQLRLDEAEGDTIIDLATETDGPVELLRPDEQGLILHGEDQLDEAKRYAARLHQQNPNDPVVIVKIDAEGLPVAFEDFSNPVPGSGRFMTMADRIKEDKIQDVIQPAIDELEYTPPPPDPLPGHEAQSLRVAQRLAEDEDIVDLASRDARAFREEVANPMSPFHGLRVEMDPDGPPGWSQVDAPTSDAIEFNYRGPQGDPQAILNLKMDPDGNVRGATFVTLGNPSPMHITRAVHSKLDELIDSGEIGIDGQALRRFMENEPMTPAGSGILFSYLRAKLRQSRGTPAHLEPPRQLDENLYKADGTAIEPGDVTPWSEIQEDFLTASRLYGESGPLMAEKYLKARARQRALRDIPEEMNPFEKVLSHKAVQQTLNRMDGMSADEIRRQFFPNTPGGQDLAIFLAEAETYAQRRAVLAAGMGFMLPEFNTLGEVAQTRLRMVSRELERLREGKPPDEKFAAMMGVDNRLSNIPPEEMEGIFQEMVEEAGNAARINQFLDKIAYMAPVENARVPVNRRVGAAIRKTHFYQESMLSRPIRSVVENKPHQWINVKDPMSDVQLVRQMEEARAVGITAQETRQFRERYMMARNEAEKMQTVVAAEDLIIERAAKMAGMDEAEFTKLMEAARQGRASTREYLNSRRYSGRPGGDKIYDSETGEAIAMPLFSTQIQTWVPLADVREIIKHSTKIRRLRSQSARVPKEIFDSFNQIWKPTVLLRGGWMLRVVSDEQLRILAKQGSLWRHLQALEMGEQPKFIKAHEKGLTGGQRVAEAYGTITLTRPLTALTQRTASALVKGGKKLGLVDPDYYALMKEAGLESLVSSRATFGGPTDNALQDIQTLLGTTESQTLNHLMTRSTGQWRSVTKDDRMYGSAWLKALNDQIGRDPLGQNVLETILSNPGRPEVWIDDVFTNARRFLRDTAEGREVSERMPWRSADPDKWIEEVVETIGYYTADFDEGLLRATKDGKVTQKLLEGIDEARRPETVHGEILDQTFGKSAVSEFIKETLAQSFDVMGRLPTDTLSRQPFFRQLYAGRMQRLQRAAQDQGVELTESAIQRMQTSARAFAINETRRYLYDLAEVSRFGHMMRFTLPFYAAWQEVLKVWGGIAMADPSVIGRAVQMWKAPNKAGLIYTDDEGEEYLQFRLSERTADNLGLTGWKRYAATGGARVGKSAFNLVLNNPLPGAGPLIQYPINEAVKRAPDLEDSLRFLLPFGVQADSSQILTSPLVRQMASELQGPENERSYQRAFADAVTWMDNLYRRGERSVPPTLEEAHEIAGKLRTIRLFTRLAAPAQPIFDSPLKPYADVYRDLQENLGPETADDVFLNEFGEEFFAVTLSRTVSKTGIPPTVEAERIRENYEELIEKYPEYGRMIIGDDAAIGEFSSAAYASQLTRRVDPDNPFSEVERQDRNVELDPETGTVVEVDRRLGWREYIQAMDIIELERKKRGLPNLRVSEAEELANAKRAVTQLLAQKYPGWWRDFNQRDDLKWDQKIKAFREIANSPAAQDRPDLQGIVDYLNVRDQVLQELNRRKMMGGSATLQAMANQDLLLAWETALGSILEDNIAFAPIYFRELEGDPVMLSRGG